MTTRRVDVNGVPIAVHEGERNGSPVLLLHGNSMSSRAFARQFEGPLGRSHTLYALDFPGHGDSGRPPDTVYSFRGFADIVLAVSEDLQLDSAVYVGWSLGGHILLEAAPSLPHAAGFCIFGAPPLSSVATMGEAFHPRPELSELWAAHLTDAQVAARAAVCVRPGTQPPPILREDIARSDPAFRPAFLKSLLDVDFADEVAIVARLPQPLAVLHGAHDQIIRLDYIQRLSMPTLWRGSVQVIDEAGHMPQWEAPSAFDRLLGAFVTDVTRGD